MCCLTLSDMARCPSHCALTPVCQSGASAWDFFLSFSPSSPDLTVSVVSMLQAIPAFLIIALMPLTYSIAYGVIAGGGLGFLPKLSASIPAFLSPHPLLPLGSLMFTAQLTSDAHPHFKLAARQPLDANLRFEQVWSPTSSSTAPTGRWTVCCKAPEIYCNGGATGAQ